MWGLEHLNKWFQLVATAFFWLFQTLHFMGQFNLHGPSFKIAKNWEKTQPNPT
jgi:hypothetical protein